MRTKALLGLAVLAAGAVTCVAQQNVYSLNIVGYVNVPVQGGGKLSFIANPLKPSNGNYNITNTFVGLPDNADGASMFKWAGAAWDTTVPNWITGYGWLPDFDVALGTGVFIQTAATTTDFNITFVGEVQTGTTAAPITGTIPSGLSIQANKVPVAEAWPGSTIGNDGDSIFRWTGTAWNTTVWQYYTGLGWNAGGATDDVNGPLLAVGQPVFYQNTGAALNWTKVFNPQ